VHTVRGPKERPRILAPRHPEVARQAGLASAKPHVMWAAGRTFSVVRFVITDAGRRAIGN
jgi:hypothetical protein